MNFISNNPTDPNIFLLTVFVGMITFSIPFLWNAYQNILDKKKHTTGEKIENILAKEFYQKSIKFFEYFVQYPFGILVFLGLFIVPILFSFELGIIFLTVVFVYFLFLPQIFQFIENKSSTDLKSFLLNKEIKSSDVLKAFRELWQRRDEDIEKEFSIKPIHTFKYFSQKIEQLITSKELLLVKKYFANFLAGINNRSIIFLVDSMEVFPKILEWHFQTWKKGYGLINKKDELEEWSNYHEILRILDSIIKIVQERALKERGSFSFFKQVKKHINKYQKEAEGKHYYAKYFFMNVFCPVFFENVTDSPERHDIWERYFPQKWEITKNSLGNEENIIPNIILHEFLEWAQDKISKREEKFDKKLDDVSMNLFPEVKPIIWAKILIFVLSPYGESRIKSMIEHPWNFGFGGRIRIYSGSTKDNKEEFYKKMDERMQSEEKEEVKNTFELVYYLAKIYPLFNQFQKENLERHIEELKGLKYPKESREENKRLRLLNIFSEMLKFLN